MRELLLTLPEHSSDYLDKILKGVKSSDYHINAIRTSANKRKMASGTRSITRCVPPVVACRH
jgi:hypothetical protein